MKNGDRVERQARRAAGSGKRGREGQPPATAMVIRILSLLSSVFKSSSWKD